jgi:VWFA-related protein
MATIPVMASAWNAFHRWIAMDSRSSSAWPAVTLAVLMTTQAPAHSQVQSPAFRSGVDLLTIETAVLTPAGDPITTLGLADFTVRIDGRVRPVVWRHMVRPGVVGSEPRGATSKSAGAAVADLRRTGYAAGAARLFVFVVDRGTIPNGEGQEMLEAAARFADGLPPADRIAVLVLGSPAVQVRFTTEREHAKRTLRMAVGTYRPPLSGKGVGSSQRDADDVIAADWRQRSHEALRDLDTLVAALASIDHPKHLIFITGGPVAAPDDASFISELGAHAAEARVSIHAIQLRLVPYQARADRMAPSAPVQKLLNQNQGAPDSLDQVESAAYLLAGITGGLAMTPVSGSIAFTRLERELSATYILAVEVEPGDRDGQRHRIDVNVSEGSRAAVVRSRRSFRVIEHPSPPPAAPVVLPVLPAGESPSGERPEPAEGPLPRPSPEVELLLSHASSGVVRYFNALSSIVCHERYVQQVERQEISGLCGGLPCTRTQVATQTLESDYLLVRLEDTAGWLPFRDVYAVNGVPVRGREDRLLRLFVDPHADRMQQADRIRAESSRYNIGEVVRDVNVPTFALQFLLPHVRARFMFRLGGRELVDGVDTQVVQYEESGRPTVIKGPNGEDVPARGQFWIDPLSGSVLRMNVETTLRREKRTIKVAFRRDPKLEMLVPETMDESYIGPVERLTARATYSDFRQFRVSTSEEIKRDAIESGHHVDETRDRRVPGPEDPRHRGRVAKRQEVRQHDPQGSDEAGIPAPAGPS